MAYSTRALMEARFTTERVRLVFTGSNSPTGGNPDDSIVTAAITRAENLINSKLNKVYTVPFTTVPALITDLCESIALLMGLKDRHGGVLPNALDPEWDALIEQLDALASGAETIPGVSRSTNILVRNTTNDGREHVYTNSHYDANGNKIEDSNWSGSLDGI